MHVNRYGEDWRYMVPPDGNGKPGKKQFVYIGKYYTLRIKDEERKPLKKMYAVYGLLSVIWLLGIGFFNPPGSRLVYVMLPYGFSILFVLFVLQSVVSILLSKRIMTREECDHSFHRARKMTVLTFVFSLVAAGGELISILQRVWGETLLWTEYAFLAGCVAECVLLWFFMQRQNRVSEKICETSEKPERPKQR